MTLLTNSTREPTVRSYREPPAAERPGPLTDGWLLGRLQSNSQEVPGWRLMFAWRVEVV